jgi:hypothetical protein
VDKVLDLTAGILPLTVDAIAESAFKPSPVSNVSQKLTGLNLPAQITTIEDRAFANNNLSSLTLSTTTSIGSSAFAENALTTLNLPATLISYPNHHRLPAVFGPVVSLLNMGHNSPMVGDAQSFPEALTSLRRLAPLPDGVTPISWIALDASYLTSLCAVRLLGETYLGCVD